jgi:hypothetical protein
MIGVVDYFIVFLSLLAMVYIYILGGPIKINIGNISYRAEKYYYTTTNKSLARILSISKSREILCHDSMQSHCITFKKKQVFQANYPVELYNCVGSKKMSSNKCLEAQLVITVNSAKWLRQSLLSR